MVDTRAKSMSPLGCSPRSRRMRSSEYPPMPRAGTNWHIAAGAAVGPGHHAQDQALVAGVEDPAEHHGEAPLELAPPALGHEPGELRGGVAVEAGRVVERGRVAVLGDAVVGLAQPLHVPAGQRELLDVDHRLVADVDVVHAGGPVDRAATPRSRP